MPNTRIDLGKQGVLVIDCRRPYVRTQAGTSTVYPWTARGMIELFNAEARRVRGPEQPLTGEAFGIAQRLAKRYTYEQMQKMTYVFWQRFSDPIYHEDSTHALRFFWTQLPLIVREI